MTKATMNPNGKYSSFNLINLQDRKWPGNQIIKAPIWCSVCLRDGNQALMQPMDIVHKVEFFNFLVRMGFKEIEVGFPAASDVEFIFLRHLIENNLIPDDVTIQVLTQCRENIIQKTFEALRGVKKAIVHLYNSTSTLQREVVFKMSKDEIIALGVKGAQIAKREAAALIGSDIRYEYSPESFTGTELEFAIEICEAVMDELGATPERPVIINLPATVEMATPNVYADQIEWFIRNMKNRESAIISLHAHNDRGTAVAATELALMAGADRVEGTLFGNGERTGNVDIATLALNMFTQGIDPGLDLSKIDEAVGVFERCTRMSVHDRHPYAGKLVYTAFSGSHQDAINKGMQAMEQSNEDTWSVPYLPIDPEDVGRTYESIIRINSQSGKGGVSWVMKQYGYALPKAMQAEFSSVVQDIADETGEELQNGSILDAFLKEYLLATNPYTYNDFSRDHEYEGPKKAIRAIVSCCDDCFELWGKGNGPIDAFCNAMRDHFKISFVLEAYHQDALGQGSNAEAVSYVMLRFNEGDFFWGVGQDSDTTTASIKAVISALNRMASDN